MTQYYPALFKPSQIAGLQVRNRIVMAPMFTNFAHTDGEVSAAQIAYYRARAKGGVGMVIVEAACVSSALTNQGPGQLHISHSRYVPGLRRLNDAIKAFGSRTFIQIVHPGRQTSSRYCGGQPVAPSATACPLMKETARALEREEIIQISDDFVQAAHYALLAGFDGVEIHAAHGYLINQFLSPRTNQREDEYGGSLENRQRFLLEIVQRIKDKLPELILSVRLNIDDFVEGGFGPPESLQVCQALEKAGADLIHCSSGTYESGLYSVEPASYPEGWRVYLAEAVKGVVNIPVITGGMIRDPEFANQVLAEGRADFVFLGRPLLADPEWANKASCGQVSDIRPCINCNSCIESEFAGLAVQCTVNPFTGRETTLNSDSQMGKPARALVIGGGPAGMQAALSLRRHGMEVVLLEKSAELGGLMRLAAIPPHKERIEQLRRYFGQQVEKSGVCIKLLSEARPEVLLALKPDVVVLATGSQPVHPTINGQELGNCVDAIDVLSGRITISGQNVVIIGGSRTGCELAGVLAPHKHRITICEKENILALGMERKNRRALMDLLEEAGVEKRTGAQIEAISPGQVRIKSSQGEETLLADSIIWATGFKPQDDLAQALREVFAQVFIIGDAAGVRGFKDAILEGEILGNTVCSLLADGRE